jgi:hypothetical protein
MLAPASKDRLSFRLEGCPFARILPQRLMEVDWSQFCTIAFMSPNSEGNGVVVELTEPKLSRLEGVVYAWIDQAGTVLRIGASNQPIGIEMLAYSQRINRSLSGLNGQTPEWEAKQWLALAKQGTLKALFHQPPPIDTVVGKVRPYLGIERHMIAKLKPVLNISRR